MKKHAYLIIAHNEPYILKSLVEMIDDIRNDIYIMIDAKAEIKQFQAINATYSKLIFLSNRIDIRWAEDSQMETELLLFETARSNYHYTYYHLLSGVDLPLKTQNEMHNFFTLNAGKEFIEIGIDQQELEHKTKYYTLFYRQINRGSKLEKSFFRTLNAILRILQRVCGIQRKYDGMALRKGSNWVSITDAFVCYLLERKDYILKTFKGIPCVDEVYKQTMFWNSPFREHLYQTTTDTASLRELDWSRGKPYIWRIEDLPHLKQCDKMFARKFSTSVDLEIIDAMKTYIQRNNN